MVNRISIWGAMRAFLYVILICAVTIPSGILINLIAFGHISEAAFREFWASVQNSNPEGRPAAWVKAKFGKPDEICRNGQTEKWRYSPGPWYAAQFDHVVFVLEDGRVVYAYADIF